MLKGLDLAFMPYIVSDEEQVRTSFGAPGAAGEFREQLREFCGCLGFQLTRDSFMRSMTNCILPDVSFCILLSGLSFACLP